MKAPMSDHLPNQYSIDYYKKGYNLKVAHRQLSSQMHLVSTDNSEMGQEDLHHLQASLKWHQVPV